MDLISIIVPIFNSAQYIYDCVESVRAQSYTDFELLLIDDGSSDNSSAICEEMCEKDKRIQLLKQNHSGVSAARNAGIKAAAGKYLFFLDSDDVLHPQLLEMLYQHQERSGAVIASEGRYYADGGSFRKPHEWETDKKTRQAEESIYLNNETAIKYLLDGNREATLYVIGGKMVRRDRLEAIRFDEKLAQGEDTLFLYRLLEEGADVIVLFHSWYYYRMYEKGASNIFSIQSCCDKCIVERYICRQEVEKGRIFNAIQKEEYIISQLMEWYKKGRRKQENGLVKYIKKLAEEEEGMYIFSQACWINRLRFFMLFHCYLLYCIAHRIVICFPQYPQIQWEIKYKNMLKKKQLHESLKG